MATYQNGQQIRYTIDSLASVGGHATVAKGDTGIYLGPANAAKGDTGIYLGPANDPDSKWYLTSYTYLDDDLNWCTAIVPVTEAMIEPA